MIRSYIYIRILLLLTRRNYRIFRDKYYPMFSLGLELSIHIPNFIQIGVVVSEPIQIKYNMSIKNTASELCYPLPRYRSPTHQYVIA